MTVPEKPEDGRRWRTMSNGQKAQARREYGAVLERRKQYEKALEAWRRSPELRAAPLELTKTVGDLERRGLLQYDRGVRRYDLHPVVRGIAAGRIAQFDKEQYGQRVVDHFSEQAHRPYEEAETLDDVRNGLHVVRTLLQMGRFQQACDAYSGDLAHALIFNLEAFAELLSLLRPFFPSGWATLPAGVDAWRDTELASHAANALQCLGELDASLAAYETALRTDLHAAPLAAVRTDLTNIGSVLREQDRLAREERCRLSALDIATLLDDSTHVFRARLDRFRELVDLGRWEEAEAMWRLLDPMGRDWFRGTYRPGDAEYAYALFRFWQGGLQEDHLAEAERLATDGRNRLAVRELHRLIGEWRLDQREWALAAESLHEAVRMAREVGQPDAETETMLALARFHLRQLEDPRQDAEQLSSARDPAHRPLAELWLAIGDREQATTHALAAYNLAWADGEPYVFRYELNTLVSANSGDLGGGWR